MATRPDSSLQAENDLAFQRRSWRIQRIGWAIFVILALAALAGLLGSGPLSRVEAGSEAAGLRIAYERFVRLHAATELVLRIDRRLARNDELVILLSGAAVEGFELSSSMPPPDGTGVAADGALLRFRTDRQPGELTIVLHTKPRRAGVLASRIGVRDGPIQDIRHWVYP